MTQFALLSPQVDPGHAAVLEQLAEQLQDPASALRADLAESADRQSRGGDLLKLSKFFIRQDTLQLRAKSWLSLRFNGELLLKTVQDTPHKLKPSFFQVLAGAGRVLRGVLRGEGEVPERCGQSGARDARPSANSANSLNFVFQKKCNL